MKRFIFALFTALLAISLCTSGIFAAEGDSAAWKFDKPINIVCPWGEGGGADSTLRALAKALKESSGIEVNVVNFTGGGGKRCGSYERTAC